MIFTSLWYSWIHSRWIWTRTELLESRSSVITASREFPLTKLKLSTMPSINFWMWVESLTIVIQKAENWKVLPFHLHDNMLFPSIGKVFRSTHLLTGKLAENLILKFKIGTLKCTKSFSAQLFKYTSLAKADFLEDFPRAQLINKARFIKDLIKLLSNDITFINCIVDFTNSNPRGDENNYSLALFCFINELLVECKPITNSNLKRQQQ